MHEAQCDVWQGADIHILFHFIINNVSSPGIMIIGNGLGCAGSSSSYNGSSGSPFLDCRYEPMHEKQCNVWQGADIHILYRGTINNVSSPGIMIIGNGLGGAPQVVSTVTQVAVTF